MAKEYYVPAVLIVSSGKPVECRLEDVVASIYYYIATNYRENLVASSRRRIKAVSILYYPFNLIDIQDRYVVVTDPVLRPVYTLSYDKPLLEDIAENVNKLSSVKGQAFVEVVENLKNLINAMYDDKEGVTTLKYEFRGVVSKRSILDEIAVLANTASKKELAGVNVPEKNIDTAFIKNTIEEILNETGRLIEELSTMISLIDKYYKDWLKQAEVEHEVKMKELERETETIKDVIEKNIKELESRIEEEKTRIEEKFFEKENELREQIRSIEEKIEIARSRVREGIADKNVENELKKLLKTKKKLEKQLESIRGFRERRKKVTEVKLRRIIRYHELRLKFLEEELERYSREFNKLVSRASSSVEELKKSINRIIEYVVSTRKKITSILLETPSRGAGKYYIPFIAILFTSLDGVESLDITPLLKIQLTKTIIGKKTRFIKTPSLYSRALKLKTIIDIDKFREDLLSTNILVRKYVNIASKGFEKLVKEDIISSDEASEVLSLVESYVET